MPPFGAPRRVAIEAHCSHHSAGRCTSTQSCATLQQYGHDSLPSSRCCACRADKQVHSAGTSAKVLLFDIMDTVVKDPFYEHMPQHFGMSFKELLAAKHPTTWIDFEKGQCSEEEAMQNFFKDGRAVDARKLRQMMVERFEFLPGMQQLLQDLHRANVDMHAITNYPVWYKLIEEKLQLSRYLDWTFMSCEGVMQANVEAADAAGLTAVLMTSADGLRQQLQSHGVLP